MRLPRITVATPSYNQAEYLEATLRSVLGQRYPALEYFVYDGGSTDDSARILQQYAGELSGWVSEKDRGQADAINRALSRATGDILCWINSDDYFLPETLWRVARILGPLRHEPVLIYGSCLQFHEAERSHRVIIPPPYDPERLQRCDYLVQPSTFWTRSAWDLVGPLNSDLHFAFDWEWYLRAAAAGVRVMSVHDVFSGYRVHASHKSGTGGERRRQEIGGVMQRYAPPEISEVYQWLCRRPQWWPWLARWRHLQQLGVPDAVGALLCPPLLLSPHARRLAAVADCFDML